MDENGRDCHMRASLQEIKRHPACSSCPPRLPSAYAELQATSTSFQQNHFEPAVQQMPLPRRRQRLLQRMVIVKYIHKWRVPLVKSGHVGPARSFARLTAGATPPQQRAVVSEQPWSPRRPQGPAARRWVRRGENLNAECAPGLAGPGRQCGLRARRHPAPAGPHQSPAAPPALPAE